MKFLFLFGLFFSLTANAQDYQQIDRFAQSVAFGKDYKSKAIELTQKFQSDEEKVRSIFSWLVHHIAYDFNLKEIYERNPNTRISGRDEADLERIRQGMIDDMVKRTLRSKKGVCQDYSYLFQKMCRSINIECVFIPGFGRQDLKEIGKVHKRDNHAWNAVKINGEWKLIDISWTVTMDFEVRGGKGFFFVDPEVFIMTHFPENPKWQLTRKTYSKQAFANLPFMCAAWLDYDIKNITPSRGILNRNDKMVDFVLDGNPDGLPIMMAVNRKPSKVEYQKIEGKYHFRIDISKIRGDFYVGLLNGQRVEPLVAFKIK